MSLRDFAVGRTKWAREMTQGLEEQEEDQAIFLRTTGNHGRLQQGGNETRHTFLKGHFAIWCGARVGRHKRCQERKQQQQPEGWGQHLACPHSPSALCLTEEVLGQKLTVGWGSFTGR